MNESPKLIWDKGSAYDLFISLGILHRPDEFGLRPSWAAGVRSRLPLPLREVLEQSQAFMVVPINWVYDLPEPKDARTALEALKALPPEDRLPALIFTGRRNAETAAFHDFLLSLDGKQRLTANIEAQILEQYKNFKRSKKGLPRAIFDAWSARKAFGEKYTEALEAYIENFFLEEEARIIPAQEQALAEAQSRSQQVDILSLVEELSAGVRLDWVCEVPQVILAPSFWSAPFVFYNNQPDNPAIILFGGRPKGMALVPGEQVPDELLNALKALADPTRLRILRHLLEGPCTPSELAKVLRLRPPTVIHHLHSLRLAGLVLVNVSPNAERRYAARLDEVKETAENLKDFLSGD